jgi:hypothetical protein
MWYRFETDEAEFLLDLALIACIQRASDLDNAGAKGSPGHIKARDKLVLASRVIAELHCPTPLPDIGTARLGAYMGPAGANEMGLDDPPNPPDERTLGEFDPRALDPRCIHGVRFAEPCDKCARPSIPFSVSDEERAALDAALEQRRAELLGGPIRKTGMRLVQHSDSCPTVQPGFIGVEGVTQCNCDFGRRMAKELGMPYG